MVFGLQKSTAIPKLTSLLDAFMLKQYSLGLWDLMSVIVSNKQFVPYYGIRSHSMKRNHWTVCTQVEMYTIASVQI